VTRTLRSLAPLFLTAKAFTATRRTRTLNRRIRVRARFPLSLFFCRAVGELLHRTLLDFRGERRERSPCFGAF
jgi:hypothetical protein